MRNRKEVHLPMTKLALLHGASQTSSDGTATMTFQARSHRRPISEEVVGGLQIGARRERRLRRTGGDEVRLLSWQSAAEKIERKD